MNEADRPEFTRELGDDDGGNLPTEAESDPDDSRLTGNFYRGLIVYLDRARGRGTIRSWSGREIHFEFPFVTIANAPIGGRAPGLNLIRQGDEVGFDVGWTGRGLRVTLIKPLITR